MELNAEFAVEADGRHVSLVLESAGGRTADGVRSRNDQYVPALRVLLGRLRDRRAVLLAALVASARVAAMPESNRILLEGPVDLADIDDVERLRLDITRAQRRVGQTEDARKEGNNRKRIQIRLATAATNETDMSAMTSSD